jgi:hypothetical protein
MVVLSIAVPNDVAAVDQNVFIADQAYQLVSAQAVYSGEGSTSSTVIVTKLTGTTAPGSGSSMLVTSFPLSSAGNINTVATGVLNATLALTQLAAGDRIGFRFQGTLTSLDGMILTLKLIPMAVAKNDTGDRRYRLSDA